MGKTPNRFNKLDEKTQQIIKESKEIFTKKLIKWGNANFRDYPWRFKRTPYKIMIAELFLQRTAADQVVDVFNIFINTHPDFNSVFSTDEQKLIKIIKSLGLIKKAEILRNLSISIIDDYDGKIPNTLKELKSLKGIGDYIANATLCFGFDKKHAIVDTNVIRIYERILGIKSRTKTGKSDKYLWQFAEKMLPDDKYIEYNYALLDFGGTVCLKKKPVCSKCPFVGDCLYNEKKRD